MESLWLLAEILVINLVLSGDNAVVIAMSSQHLPEPKRKQAVWWGVGGAVLLRCLLTVVAMWLIQIPLLKAAGGLLLFVIAVQLLADRSHAHSRDGASFSLWSAVQTILIADFVMSLDNVLAIAAIAKGQMTYIIIGIALSIPIIVWGSTIISKWLQRMPLLIFAGSGILGFTAGEMIASDERLALWMPRLWMSLHHGLPWAMVALVMIVGTVIRYQDRIRVD
ncbi:TerC family protein [Paenibacillus sp. OSY-SE]|uniref:TerC family protein n=1 Tax=Paenibacillus sp. OSY-SE TaxID=1196323 RepID=UPI0003092129|nr:TerC family protein [Paenibacillus sp. OSY-SE]